MLSRIFSRTIRTCVCARSDQKSSASVKDLLENSATFDDLKPSTSDDAWATLPYAEGTALRRDQSNKALRPKIDPKETSIILFPGQGAQFVGMAKNLVKFPGARDIFELANEVLK